MPENRPSSERVASRRRLARRLARTAALGSALLIIGGFIGQAIRDRTIGFALLMYLPLLPVGMAAVALDAAWRGRSLPRPRFGLTALGLVAIAWSGYDMTGRGISDRPTTGDREFRVLHWNVLWGGGLFRGPHSWAAQCATIAKRRPDVVVLSEAPPGDWLDRLVAELGAGASYVGMHHDPSSPYWYRLAVFARGPIRREEPISLPGGAAMSVVVDLPDRRLRLLVVDGMSAPSRSRLPFLHAIARACQEADALGATYDLVLGDFNTPSRSLGFDDLEALGYRLAGRSARGWRGTFPSWFPVYDIDHVWLRAGLGVGSCGFFNGPYSDHRGQLVRILLPKEAPP